jgi:hypothetical protein
MFGGGVLHSGTIPRLTNGKASFAPPHTNRKSNGSCMAVIPAPACHKREKHEKRE